ncbi:uncharacterized protein LOC135281073 isoform X8 [Passer domesticus]|uniref:uncharacterized protein LOC135281073 isoform X8 n=1 Tax=Passer domesticus TaxID=48849 RepID=UPI0030FE435C
MVLFCMGRVLKPSGVMVLQGRQSLQWTSLGSLLSEQLKVCGDFDDTNERHLVHAPEQLTVLCWKLQTEADCTMLDSFQGISFSAPVLQVLLNHSECAGLSPGLWRAVDVSVWLWQRLGQELVLLCTQRRRSTRSAPLGPAEQAWFTSARTCCTWRKEGCPGTTSLFSFKLSGIRMKKSESDQLKQSLFCSLIKTQE